MIDHLTEQQERIVRCIREWVAETGEYPTIREIGAAVGLRSPSSVLYHLRRMEAQGIVVHDGRRQRSYRLSG
jgi:repressor LexA